MWLVGTWSRNVRLPARRLRCLACHLRFPLAAPALTRLVRAKLTARLPSTCAQAGNPQPYATAARVLRWVTVASDEAPARQQQKAETWTGAPTMVTIRVE
jgi:hypothetical protein